MTDAKVNFPVCGLPLYCTSNWIGTKTVVSGIVKQKSNLVSFASSPVLDELFNSAGKHAFKKPFNSLKDCNLW